MRVSDIGNWAACEVMALQSPLRQAGRTNVAAWVGTLAHGLLSGEQTNHPPKLALDTLTPSEWAAAMQAKAIAAKARELLTEQGWGVVGREEEVRRDELTGHLDIRAYHRDHGEAIIDLKTGQGIGTAWLQVGGYIWTGGPYTGDYIDLDTLRWGGVLHVPRQRIDRDQKGTLELRPSKDLFVAWKKSIRRVMEVLDGAQAVHSPGLHCKRCQLTSCPVRV